MNILVYPHQMIIGGSQINALELAAKVRDRGHTVAIVAPDGPLVEMVKELRLPFHRTVSASETVSPRNAAQVHALARKLQVDLIHAYEWRPTMEMCFGPHLLGRTPLVASVLSMDVANFLPRHLPLIVGTCELAELMQRKRFNHVEVVEPPIDTEQNRSRDISSARMRWSFAPHETVFSVVCRLTHDLHKLEGVLDAVAVIGRLAKLAPVRLLVVGGGQGLEEVRRRAGEINSEFGQEVIVVTGPLSDPRDAYEASDVVLGMGSSILRAMAFGKPVVVQGENGFWQLLDKESLKTFLWQGWFGNGGDGADGLHRILSRLLQDPVQLVALGQLGREVVESRFDLDKAADRLITIYQHAVSQEARKGFLPSVLWSAASFTKCEVQRLYRRRASAAANE